MRSVIICLVSVMAGFAGAAGNPYELNLDELKKVDPGLLGYEQVRGEAVGLEKPEALAVGGDGRIYVGGAGKLKIWSADLSRAEERKTDGDVTALAVDDNGTVFMGLTGHVEVVPVHGEKVAWAELGEGSRITSLALAGGSVFIADAGQRVLWKYSKAGRLEARIGGRDSVAGKKGFIIPSANFDAAAAGDGTLWVVNPGMHTLIHIDAEGKLLDSWRKASQSIEGFCGCCNPCDIAVMNDGSLLTGEKGLMRVKVVSAKGELVSVVAGPLLFEESDVNARLGTGAKPGQAEAIADLAVKDGRVFVLDRNAGLLRVFEKKAAK